MYSSVYISAVSLVTLIFQSNQNDYSSFIHENNFQNEKKKEKNKEKRKKKKKKKRRRITNFKFDHILGLSLIVYPNTTFLMRKIVKDNSLSPTECITTDLPNGTL